MIYPSSKNSLLRTQKVTSKGTRIIDLANQRILQKRTLAQSNFKKKPQPSPQFSTPADKLSRLTTSTHPLSLVQTFSLTVCFDSAVGSSQRQYITVLEQSTKKLQGRVLTLEGQLRKKEEVILKEKESDRKDGLKSQMRFMELCRYYQESRKELLACSMELIDCKAVLCQTASHLDRVGSISGVLHRNQVLLRAFNFGDEEYQKLVEQSDQAKILLELKQLRQVNSFQQKIIQQLKSLKDTPTELFESQKRLLRHEINRVFSENEELKKELETNFNEYFQQLRTLKDFSPRCSLLLKGSFDALNEIDRLREEKYKFSVENQFLEERLYQEKKESQKLVDTVQRLNEDLRAAKTRPSTPGFRQEKYIEQNSAHIQQLEKTIEQLKQKLIVTQTLLQQANQRLSCRDQLNTTPLRRQTDHLMNSNIDVSPIRRKPTDNQSALQDLEQVLADRPDGLSLLHSYSSKAQGTIQKLREEQQVEKEQKEKVLKWCKKIYQLLKHSKLPEETIEEHLRQFQQFKPVKGSHKIRQYLEQIQHIVSKFEKYQTREVEQQLSQYLIALKKRGDVIKQVENQDGSSIQLTDHYSQAFTDQQSHLSDHDIQPQQ